MKLPPYRYPGYHSLPKMLLEKFCTDKATGSAKRLWAGEKKHLPLDHQPGKPSKQ